jgi:transposase
MTQKLYHVRLSADERARLLELTRRGKVGARQLRRAHILLLADEGAKDEAIADSLHVSVPTVRRTRQRFARENLDRALAERPRPGARRKLDGKVEAFLMALACSDAPEGREHWTMQLLADRLVQLRLMDSLSDETVRRVLKRGTSNPG